MLTKKILITASVLLTSVITFGQSIDAKSKTILDAVTQKYNANKNNYFKFSFGTGTQGKVSKTELGTYYSSGNKYKLKIMGTEQIFDGNKIYNISEEDSEVTIARPNAHQAMFSPINYLNNYRKEFHVSHAGQHTLNGIRTDYIKLTPVKKEGLSVVKLFIDTKNNRIIQLEQHGTNKDVAVIAIKEHKANQNLSSDMFVFNKSKYANYIITEL